MSIDEIRELIEGLEKYVPEEYIPTDFDVIVSIDMDGVLAEFMTNPETYMPKLRQMRGEYLEIPKNTEAVTVESLIEHLSKLIEEVKDYQGDVNKYQKDVEESFGNVLKNFNSPPWLEPEYYRWLPPMENMVKAIRCLSKVPQIIDDNGVPYNLKLKICSCSPNDKASLDKYIWISQYLPEIDSVTIVPYDENNSGRNKAIALGLPISDPELPEPTPELIEHRKKSVCIHLDDNTKVMRDMMKNGIDECIKCLNGINDTHKSWEGPRISILDSDVSIFRNLIKSLSQISARVMTKRYELQSQREVGSKDISQMPDIDEIHPINDRQGREDSHNDER